VKLFCGLAEVKGVGDDAKDMQLEVFDHVCAPEQK
jgi:hypothetical protein